MVRQTNPRKNQQKRQNEPNEVPLKTKRKDHKEKYRHQNNWLEDEVDDFDLEENLYSEDDDDYIFDDELDTDFDENIQEEKDGNEEETDNDKEDDYDY